MAVGAAGLGLLLAYLLKRPCALNPWVDGFQYRRLCYSDIQPLYGLRGVADGLVPYRDVEVEYPVLTGTFMYLVGRLLVFLNRLGRELPSLAGLLPATVNDQSYFRLTALMLAPFSVATTLLLRPRVPRSRLLLWALGTPTILYSFTNWDLLAVAGAVWGVVELERARNGVAGAALGLGASAKLFPAFFLPGALLQRWSKRDRRGAARVGIGFSVAAAAANLPWMLIAWNGWAATWVFHSRRYPDLNTLWFWIAHHGRRLAPSPWWEVGHPGYQSVSGVVGFIVLAIGSGWYLWRGWRRRGEGDYPVVATGLGILILFMLTTKAHSPQYALWVLPFLALLNIPWPLVVAYLAADLGVFVSGFHWYLVFGSPAPAWKGIYEGAILIRGAVLAGIAWWAARAVRVTPRPESLEISSRPE
ncbi:MAG: glycosyltransferase 87 family protein [Actinomycetota bacterium]